MTLYDFVRHHVRRSLGVGGSPASWDEGGSNLACPPKSRPAGRRRVTTRPLSLNRPTSRPARVSAYQFFSFQVSLPPPFRLFGFCDLLCLFVAKPNPASHAFSGNRHFRFPLCSRSCPKGAHRSHPCGANLYKIHHLRAIALRQLFSFSVFIFSRTTRSSFSISVSLPLRFRLFGFCDLLCLFVAKSNPASHAFLGNRHFRFPLCSRSCPKGAHRSHPCGANLYEIHHLRAIALRQLFSFSVFQFSVFSFQLS